MRLFRIVLILAGLAMLAYVGLEYAGMVRAQRHLAREWSRQEQAAQTTPSAPATDAITRITIPRIRLDAYVVEGTTKKQLLLGPAHLEHSAEPGAMGNAVITAHRDTFFRHIYELSPGDVVELRRGGALYRYEVTGKKVVDPQDVSVIRASSDARLTLITCYPTYYIGPAPERLVVFARLSPADEEGQRAGAH